MNLSDETLAPNAQQELDTIKILRCPVSEDHVSIEVHDL